MFSCPSHKKDMIFIFSFSLTPSRSGGPSWFGLGALGRGDASEAPGPSSHPTFQPFGENRRVCEEQDNTFGKVTSLTDPALSTDSPQSTI